MAHYECEYCGSGEYPFCCMGARVDYKDYIKREESRREKEREAIRKLRGEDSER